MMIEFMIDNIGIGWYIFMVIFGIWTGRSYRKYIDYRHKFNDSLIELLSAETRVNKLSDRYNKMHKDWEADKLKYEKIIEEKIADMASERVYKLQCKLDYFLKMLDEYRNPKDSAINQTVVDLYDFLQKQLHVLSYDSCSRFMVISNPRVKISDRSKYEHKEPRQEMHELDIEDIVISYKIAIEKDLPLEMCVNMVVDKMTSGLKETILKRWQPQTMLDKLPDNPKQDIKPQEIRKPQ